MGSSTPRVELPRRIDISISKAFLAVLRNFRFSSVSLELLFYINIIYQ